MNVSFTLLTSALALMLVAHSPTSLAQDQLSKNQQMLVRDAKTGELRAPTAEERQVLLAPRPGQTSVSTSTQTFSHPSGAGGMLATDEMASYVIVSRTPDGKLVENCVATKSLADKTVKVGEMPPAPQQAPAK